MKMRKAFVWLFLILGGIYMMLPAFKEEEHEKIRNQPKIEITESNEKQGLADQIQKYLIQENIDCSKIAIYIHGFATDEVYSFHSDVDFTAASLYKLPLAMLYYDFIRDGQYQSDTLLQYHDYHYEPGGPIGDTYAPYSWIPLITILHHMIIDSDNTAGHILYEGLGGWLAYREACANAYLQGTINDSFFTYDNVITAQNMNDVLQYLYDHKGDYKLLIDDMYQAMPYQYLNLKLSHKTAQKYGWYGNAVNAAGIVWEGNPYSIVVLTDLGESGEMHIGKINQLCYAYFNE